jgi:hypothetical protein
MMHLVDKKSKIPFEYNPLYRDSDKNVNGVSGLGFDFHLKWSFCEISWAKPGNSVVGLRVIDFLFDTDGVSRRGTNVSTPHVLCVKRIRLKSKRV